MDNKMKFKFVINGDRVEVYEYLVPITCGKSREFEVIRKDTSDKEEKETRINEPQMHTKLRHTQFSQFFERECMSCFKIASHLLIMLLCLGSSLSYEFCLPKVIRKFASPETSASEQRHDA